MTKTLKVKLNFPTLKDHEHWINLLFQARECYNLCSKIVFEEKTPTSLKLYHSACYNRAREAYPNIPAQAVIKIYKNLMSNMRTAKANEVKLKHPLLKRSLSISLDKRLYSKMTNDDIRLESFIPRKRAKVNFQKYKRFNEFCQNYTKLDPIIMFENGTFWLSIPFNIPEKPITVETPLGVDRGIRRLVVTSDGMAIKGNEFIRLKRRSRFLKRKLQSKGTKNAKRKLKRLSRKESRITKDFVHRVANKILKTDKTVIVLEDLKGIKTKTSKTDKGVKRTKHNNRFSQIPLYLLQQVLTYKAPLVGKRVATVSPSYTSQIDCVSGKKEGNRVGCRFYAVDGRVYDADWNAAINIANRSKLKHPISMVPLDGKLSFWAGSHSQRAKRPPIMEGQAARSSETRGS